MPKKWKCEKVVGQENHQTLKRLKPKIVVKMLCIVFCYIACAYYSFWYISVT